MSTKVFTRPPRRTGPAMPSGDLVLEPPPDLPTPGQRSVGQMLMLLPMLAMVGAMVFMYAGRGGGVLMMVVGGLFGVSMLGMFVGSFLTSGGDQKAAQTTARRDYMRYLSQTRRQVRRAAIQQRESMRWRHPAAGTLWAMAASTRLWERRFSDTDFGELRMSLGKQRLAVSLVTPETKPVEDLEPLSALALRRFVRAYSNVEALPMALQVRRFRRLVFRGDAAANRDLVRAMLCQAAVFHSPDDLRIAVVAGTETASEWDWVKWLPHSQHAREADALGARRLLTTSLAELEELLEDELGKRHRNVDEPAGFNDHPHVLVVVDGGHVDADDDLAGAGLSGVSVLDIAGTVPRYPRPWLLPLDNDGARLTMEHSGRTALLGQPDGLGEPEAAAVARRLARFRPATATSASEPLAVSAELPDLLGLGDVARLDPRKTWRTGAPTADRLSTPLGLDPAGDRIVLDIKESAQGGMGPHGLIIGATGSGKSELLRTIVTGLAVTHSSSELNFVLVDFKGGATFATLDQLPHTSAVITNLEDELHLVDRMADAIRGELTRRQELLRAAGNFVSQRDYEKARRAGADLAQLPSLLVICDEFSELLSAQPDFIDLFVMIGRLGRSLGVHLLLASQRLEEGRLRGLDSHLSYRIGLRTFSAMESRVVLGVPDAYELPNSPGHGYMKIDTDTMLRFRSAYVSGPYRDGNGNGGPGHALRDRPLRFTSEHLPLPDGPTQPILAATENIDDISDSLMAVITARLHDQGPPAHQVWLDPLDESPALSRLFPPLVADPKRGLCPTGQQTSGGLRVPVGIVDRPFEQRRDSLTVDLSGAGGNLVIVGGTQAGKSTGLRSVIASLALTHTPAEVQFYCLDFGGGTLRALNGLPHVGSVVGRKNIDEVRRTVAEMSALLDERESAFAEAGIDSMETYRRRKAAGEFADDPFGDAFLVVDGWPTIRADFEELEDDLQAIAQRGLAFGVHMMVATNRWTDLRAALRDLFGTRLELRLGDPSESEINRRAAKNVPERAPGRGVTPDAMQMLIALPRLDDSSEVSDLTDGVGKLVSLIAGAWHGEAAPAVRLLPARVDVAELPTLADVPGVSIGLNESHLAPVNVDFAAEPHFLVFGDVECGKTNLLRMLAGRIADRYPKEQARFLAVDYRRTLLGEFSSEHLAGYAAGVDEGRKLMRDAAEALRTRLPGPDVTPEQLRARNWWQGPDLYIFVDDYDIVAGGSYNPITELLDLLAQARDIGLHLIVARRMGGAARAMFEPVIQRLRELQSPGLLMSGNRDEGLLLGDVRPAPRPPGRGILVRRSGNQLIQAAWSPPGGV
ncbi:type VII secretion protein EccC [Stackebrandtia nassauensis]|uniref:Cell division FtsK/SpoIIIE n=1 Tax=Stackebrandtia nassauensis (strain DSM 44728 / CIP 108903 / NRRL B-16338 / NBRC 102104 / LLR-40K-21) TaxID=446470 RepID=D3Q4G4_STANL|nr:type VII secretion protein EccC [Stackebrandtia nassauensis]ADD40124.1 cell division FtsK/SpoIIIE [Stackebrandtia nassauensis DSM 44728]